MEHIGIDLHKRESQICVLNAVTGEVAERRVPTSRASLTQWLGGRAPARVLLEAGTESRWVAAHLEALGHEVVVADPGYAPMYPRRGPRQKTDQRDARALAEASVHGTYRAVHRVSAAQWAVRQTLTARDVAVRTRTRQIAVLRAVVRSTGARVPAGHADTFGARVTAVAVPPAEAATVALLQPLLAAADAARATTETALRAQVADDAVVALLQTVPGVGLITSAAFRAALDTPARFGDARTASSYVGLVPRARDSGDHHHRGHVSKAGATRTRWLLVQAAWTILRSSNPAVAPLRTWAEQVARRRGRRIAVVALARRLSRILYAMWRDGRPFDPPTLTRRRGRAAGPRA